MKLNGVKPILKVLIGEAEDECQITNTKVKEAQKQLIWQRGKHLGTKFREK